MNLKTYFSEAYKIDDFDSYSKLVGNDLSRLIKTEIMNYKYSDVIVIGRKSLSLFHPYIEEVVEIHGLQGIYAIRLFSHTEYPILRNLKRLKYSKFWPIRVIEERRKRYYGKIILLVDAIKTGNEISTVFKTVGLNRVSKVCGYLAIKDGLIKLQKEHPKIQFSFPNIVVDEKSYDIEQDKLENVHQSRLISSDGDHLYRLYSLKYQITEDDLVNYAYAAISKFKRGETELGEPDIEKKELIVPYMVSYTIHLDYNAIIRENPELSQNLYEIEQTKLRLKFDKNLSHLGVTALALAQLKQEFVYRECDLKFQDKMCQRTIFGGNVEALKDDDPRQKFCPFCVDRNISNYILSYFEKELFQILKSNGVKIESLRNRIGA